MESGPHNHRRINRPGHSAGPYLQARSIDRPVLVIGERGTGKELAAERLHYYPPLE